MPDIRLTTDQLISAFLDNDSGLISAENGRQLILSAIGSKHIVTTSTDITLNRNHEVVICTAGLNITLPIPTTYHSNSSGKNYIIVNESASNVTYNTSSGTANIAAGETCMFIAKSNVSVDDWKKITFSSASGSSGGELDPDLQAIASLSATSGILRKNGTNTWELDTTVYAKMSDIPSLSGYLPLTGGTLTGTTSVLNINGTTTAYNTSILNITDNGAHYGSQITVKNTSSAEGAYASITLVSHNNFTSNFSLTEGFWGPVRATWSTDSDEFALRALNPGANDDVDVFTVKRTTGLATFSGDVVASSYRTPTGLATQFLKANGTLDSNTYLTTSTGYAVISVRVATTANITLSGLQTIDGVSVVANDLVLVVSQTTVAENGVYVVASGAWTRFTGYSTVSDYLNDTIVVTQGSTQINTRWRSFYSGGGTPTIGSTDMIIRRTDRLATTTSGQAGIASFDSANFTQSNAHVSLAIDSTTEGIRPRNLRGNSGSAFNTNTFNMFVQAGNANQFAPIVQNTTTNPRYLRMVGTGSLGALPTWQDILGTEITTSGHSVLARTTGSTGTLSEVLLNTNQLLGRLSGNVGAINMVDLPISTATQTALNGKENTITAGTTSQYWRGDKTWQILNTSAVAEGTNLYYTNTRGIGSTLGTLTLSNAPISAGDSIQTAFGEAQGQIDAINTTLSGLGSTYVLKAGDTMTGNLSISNNTGGTMFTLNAGTANPAQVLFKGALNTTGYRFGTSSANGGLIIQNDDNSTTVMQLDRTTNNATFSNRVTAGSLTSNGDLSVGTTSIFNGEMRRDGAAGTNRGLFLRTGTSSRWYVHATSGAEAGSNAGSAFGIAAYDDSGTLIDNPITITRASGGNITFARPFSGTSATLSSTLSVGTTSIFNGNNTHSHTSDIRSIYQVSGVNTGQLQAIANDFRIVSLGTNTNLSFFSNGATRGRLDGATNQWTFNTAINAESQINQTNTATTGQPIFQTLNNSVSDALSIRYTETAVGSIGADQWQYRLGGTSFRPLVFTNYDTTELFKIGLTDLTAGVNLNGTTASFTGTGGTISIGNVVSYVNMPTTSWGLRLGTGSSGAVDDGMPARWTQRVSGTNSSGYVLRWLSESRSGASMGAEAERMSLSNAELKVAGKVVADSKLITYAGGQSLDICAGENSNHTYLAFYARQNDLTNRSGFIGYANDGATVLTISNALGGGISITNGTSITGTLGVSGAITGASFTSTSTTPITIANVLAGTVASSGWLGINASGQVVKSNAPNPFNQALNTSDSPTFNTITSTNNIVISGIGGNVFSSAAGQIQLKDSTGASTVESLSSRARIEYASGLISSRITSDSSSVSITHINGAQLSEVYITQNEVTYRAGAAGQAAGQHKFLWNNGTAPLGTVRHPLGLDSLGRLVQGYKSIQSTTVTTGSISYDLASGTIMNVGNALTGDITLTITNPSQGMESLVIINQGATSRSVTLSLTGVNWYLIGPNGTTSTNTLTIPSSLFTASKRSIIQLSWTATTECYVEVTNNATGSGGGGSSNLLGSVSITDTAWSGNTDYTYTTTITGAVLGDSVNVSPDKNVADVISSNSLVIYAWVSAVNTVSVRVRTSTYVSLPTTRTFRLAVIK